MKTIVYQDRISGAKYIYNPQNIKLDILKNHERIETALNELRHVGNVNIYLYKHNKMRLISTHTL